MKSLTTRIIDWNRIRNSLNWSPNLETKMLSEEANEFFMADNLVDRLRECADFMFVLIGSRAKYYAQSHRAYYEVGNRHEDFRRFERWAEDVFDGMRTALGEEIKDYHKIDKLLAKVLEAVVDANDLKGTERDETGKIQKGTKYVSPVERIMETVREGVGAEYVA
jgi:hypothetical protein